MDYGMKKTPTVMGSQFAHSAGAPGISGSVTPPVRRDVAKRNFVLQQGFEDPDPSLIAQQYSALVFQPKVVLVAIVAGTLFQSQSVFFALCAVLWWNALFPKLNPISALYNRTIGRRPGAFRLGPAPAPRRAAETEAGTFALATALVIHAQLSLAAHVLQAIFLAAALAVMVGSFCTGTFMYHLLRGRWKFVRQTLPWASQVPGRP